MNRLYCARATCCRRNVQLYKVKVSWKLVPVFERWPRGALSVGGGGVAHAELPLCPRHAARVSQYGFGPWRMKGRVGAPLS
jgi:hypothetical protein